MPRHTSSGVPWLVSKSKLATTTKFVKSWAAPWHSVKANSSPIGEKAFPSCHEWRHRREFSLFSASPKEALSRPGFSLTNSCRVFPESIPVFKRATLASLYTVSEQARQHFEGRKLHRQTLSQWVFYGTDIEKEELIAMLSRCFRTLLTSHAYKCAGCHQSFDCCLIR